MKRSLLTSLSIAALTTLSIGQQVLCGTDQERARQIALDPTYLQREAEFQHELDLLIANSAAQRQDGDQVYRIPVVFHVLHLRGIENITNEQIQNQIDILNRDYDADNADSTEIHPSFADLFTDMDIEFRLATVDPVGQCTNGIVRHQSVETFSGESTSKLTPWPRSQYLNIWVTRQIGSGAAGYFTYGPWSALDGVVILQQYVGNIGTGTENTSRAITHEVGHYLSLAHVWGGNNGVPDENTPIWAMQTACGDDGVEDTPFTRGWNQCPASTNTQRPWADCKQVTFATETAPDVYEDGLLYNFDATTTGTGTTDPTAVPNALDPEDDSVHASASPFTAVGVSANTSVDGRFAFTNWGTGANDGEIDYNALTGAIDLTNYYQFTITPTVKDQITITGFSGLFTRNSTGARTFAVRSSANNYSTNMPLTLVDPIVSSIQSGNVAFFNTDDTQDQLVDVTLPAAGHTNLEGPLTFRIYGWNAEDASGSFEMDNFRVFGKFGVIENVQNYMEYSYCSYMFTDGQRARARAAINSPTYQRNLLWTTSNLQNTGTADDFVQLCAPECDFYAQVGLNDPANPVIPFEPMVCDNVSVRFVDNTARATVDTWAWSFQDGTPATSTVRNPTVQFSGYGWKTVTLTVTNAQGSSTKTDPYAVYVGTPDAALTPYYESFETMVGEDIYPYTSFNFDNNHTSFRRFEGGGATGNACVMLNSGDRNQLDFIDPDNAGDFDDFVTPLLNLTGSPNATFSFRYAYSTNTADLANVTEKLEVWSSTDCGRNWFIRGTIDQPELITNGNNNTVPPSQWTLKSFTLPGSLLAQDVRFRFRFISSAYSNHLFIDDIWTGVAVGLEELSSDGFITLFPNPTNGTFNMQVKGMESSATEITISDLRGATVYQNKVQPKGGALIEIDGREIGLNEGLYMVRASNNAGSSVQKLIMGR